MVQEAEEFADQDAAEKADVEARNQLEAYLYNLKNSVNDALAGKLGEADQERLSGAVEDALVWLEDHPTADKATCDEKQKEVELIANPILKAAYESIHAEGGAPGDDFLGADVDGAGDHAVDDEPSVEEVD